MICVYDIGNTAYDKNGDAVLKPLSGSVKQVAGGSYDLQMEVAMDPEGKWKHLVPGAIVKASVPEEVIENAYSGMDADVYKTNTEAALREGASEPEIINYPAWQPLNSYAVGAKVTYSGKNYRCDYWDSVSALTYSPPSSSSWWTEIARRTSGAAALVTLAAGSELYFVEDYNTDWYKMSTFYGLVGYIKKSQVTFDRHLTPSETTPRIITEQLFRITEPTIDSMGQKVSVSGMHVSYDLAGILIQDVSIGQASPAMAIGLMMDAMMVPYDGVIATNLTSDANGTYTGKIKGKNAMYALLDPDAGIASSFNAKFTRDNWDVFLMQRQTVDRGYRIRYGKNARGITWQKSSANIVTRVVPVAKDEKGADLYLPEKWIDSPLISQYPVIRMERLPVKGQVGKDKGNNDGSVWTESDLLDEMRAKAAERFSVDHADLVSHEVTVQVEQLGDTVEYEWMKGLETVLLYDTVAAIDENIGLVMPLLVTEIEWDIVRNRIAGLKLSNKNDLKKRTVTGYNVQNNSISSEKLMDGVAQEILEQAVDIIPEFAEPFDAEGHMNTKDQDGLVQKGDGQATKVWKTDAQGNPAWRDGDFILQSEKGQPNGVATLDNAGKVPENQMPSYVDDIIEGYLYNGQFYKNSAHTQLITPETGKIYVDLTTGDNLEYRWSGSVYSQISKTSVNDNNPTLAWGTKSKVGDVAGVSLHVTMPGNPASASDSDPTLAWGTRSKVGTANGVDLHVTMPGNPDTWRPVVDNLTSTDTDKSLSANQGKVLNDNIAKCPQNYYPDTPAYAIKKMLIRADRTGVILVDGNDDQLTIPTNRHLYVGTSHDANNFTDEETTYYWLNGYNPAHVPGSNGFLRVYEFGGYLIQLCSIANGQSLYYRFNIGGTWYGWTQLVANSGNEWNIGVKWLNFNKNSSLTYDANSPSICIVSDYGTYRNFANFPPQWRYGALWTIPTENSYNEAMNAQFCWDVQHYTNRAGRLWFRTRGTNGSGVDTWKDWSEILNSDTVKLQDSIFLQAGTTEWNSPPYSFQIYSGYITGSGNYIDVFIPCNVKNISGVTSVTLGSDAIAYTTGGMKTMNGLTSTSSIWSANGIYAEFALPSGATPNTVASLRTSAIRIVAT